jgi:hypothetical protein
MNSQINNIKSFPPITKQRALEIAARALNRGGQFECYSQKPDSCRLYSINTDQPCWYIYPQHNDLQPALRSSRVIVISRLTGEILYDGSAGDEG